MNSELQRSLQRIETSPNGAAKPKMTVRVFTPRVDVVDTNDALTLFAELPGVKQEDVSLTCKGDALILHAPCLPRHADKKPLYSECRVGDYYREFKITEQVETDRIEASLIDGVLTICAPKSEAIRPKRIAVKG